MNKRIDNRIPMMLELKTQGKTYAEIGTMFGGLCRQRIQQILGSIGYKVPKAIDLFCSYCHTRKARTEFYISKGHTNGICKPCNTLRMREYRNTHKDKIKNIAHRSYLKHTDRSYARGMANHKFSESKSCEIDGCDNPGERHHDDYSKPLEIRWLCRKHHALLHATLKCV